MKKVFFILFFTFFIQQIFAQKEAAIWYFGGNAGLDFNSGTPVAIFDGLIDTKEGCSSISDSNGNLLFYSDGITVWNKNHLPMPNGTGLFGDSSASQSAIIVPKPNDPDIFYIFTTSSVENPLGTHYSTINITLNGGLGDVTSKNTLLLTEGTEKLTAVKHANNTDVWVITHDANNNSFLAYLVTSTGVSTSPVTTNIGLDLGIKNGLVNKVGIIKASPDGTKIAITHRLVGAEILDFDASTGILSNPQFLSDETGLLYGLEFSPSGRFLYLGKHEFIYQYDLNATNIVTSAMVINNNDYSTGALQLGIDGKIYICQYGKDYLSVINNPENLGTACNYVHNGINLGSGISYLGLPPFIQSFFLVDINTQNLCFGDATEFSVQANGTITSINWDFGDGNTSTDEEPTHIYAAPGTYTVSVAVVADESKTETKEITIYTTPIANAASDYEICNDELTYEFNLATKNAEILGAQTSADNIITYYPTLIDAQNRTNVLADLYTNTNPVETIYARIENTNNSVCYSTTNFDIIVKQEPLLNYVEDWVICDTDADGLYIFDLSLKNTEILGSQVSADFTINYFATQADADANTNTLSLPYTNTNSQEQIFFRIQNTVYPECYQTGSFNIEVITGVVANQPPTLELCDIDNDGYVNYNLSLQDNTILGTQNATNFTISYHASQNDADTNSNPFNASTFVNTEQYSQIIYARVENNGNNSCYNTTSFELRVYDTPLTTETTNWNICDLNNDGQEDFDLTLKDAEILNNQNANNFTVSYYITHNDAITRQNAIAGIFQNTTNPQTIYYRIENSNNNVCFSTSSFDIEVNSTPTAFTPTSIITCDLDETGLQTFDLSNKDNEILNGQDANVYSVSYFLSEADATNNSNALPKESYNNASMNETLYARIENRNFNSCFDLTHFDLIINPLPQPPIEETYVICPDSLDLVINGGDFESWSWKMDTIEIETGRIFNVPDLGTYSLTVSQTINGITCENTILFEVVSSGAPETLDVDINGFSDNIEVIANTTGMGNFEYSIDGENFQFSNRFEVFPGEYTVYVRDEYLCRTLTEDIVAIGYQKFFTPNGDDQNEYWNIIGGENFPNSQLFIYDRYGKLIAQVSPMSLGWNGTYNGRSLPESDYWFKYIYDSGKVYSGHFALKR